MFIDGSKDVDGVAYTVTTEDTVLGSSIFINLYTAEALATFDAVSPRNWYL